MVSVDNFPFATYTKETPKPLSSNENKTKTLDLNIQ